MSTKKIREALLSAMHNGDGGKDTDVVAAALAEVEALEKELRETTEALDAAVKKLSDLKRGNSKESP